MSNILTSTDKGILTITINRPDKLNALNYQIIQDIGKAIADSRKRSRHQGNNYYRQRRKSVCCRS